MYNAQPGPAWTPQPPVRSWRQWQAYVRAQIEAGRPPATLLPELAASGMSQQDGYRLLHEVAGELRKRAYIILAVGVGLVLAGLAVTFGTMNAAEDAGGGTYVVWFGPVICGVIAALRGIYELNRIPNV